MPDWTLTCLPVGPLQTNAYLLTDRKSGEAVLVDPGFEGDLLLGRVADSGCRLVHLLCTHGHFDHVSAAAAIQAEHDLPLLCHAADIPLVTRMPEVQAAYGFTGSAVPRVEPLATEQAIPFSTGELTVTHVPGHSPGHVMFSWDGQALVGDCVFAGSIGRTDLPGASFPQLARSIRERIYTLPSQTELYPGHGPATSVAVESETNPFVRISPS